MPNTRLHYGHTTPPAYSFTGATSAGTTASEAGIRPSYGGHVRVGRTMGIMVSVPRPSTMSHLGCLRRSRPSDFVVKMTAGMVSFHVGYRARGSRDRCSQSRAVHLNLEAKYIEPKSMQCLRIHEKFSGFQSNIAGRLAPSTSYSERGRLTKLATWVCNL